MKARGLENQILIGESDTIPYAARLDKNKSCNIFGVKGSVWASAVPASATDRLLQKIEGILPVKLLPLPSALAVALANTNMIIHCPTMIMNAGRIETGERFRFYNDGMSASVCSVMEKMDEERLAVGKAWGYNLVTEFEDALANYDLDSTQYRNLHEIFSLHPVYSKMGADSPQSVTHRYLSLIHISGKCRLGRRRFIVFFGDSLKVSDGLPVLISRQVQVLCQRKKMCIRDRAAAVEEADQESRRPEERCGACLLYTSRCV